MRHLLSASALVMSLGALGIVACSPAVAPAEGEGEGEGEGELCGNGAIDVGEACDTDDHGDESCLTQGFAGGALACSRACELDTSTCTAAAATCGNGAIDASEACDGTAIGAASCASLGLGTGDLQCTVACIFDVSACSVAPVCGNAIVEGNEACDPPDGVQCSSTCQPVTEQGHCADNVDNDADLEVDCADPDCSGDPVCVVNPIAADELLFQEGLALYTAVPPDYLAAQAKFDQLLTTFPGSLRHDNAGYLAGRCRYELGDFAGAITVLSAMRTQHPTSPFVDQAAYFSGRSRYALLDYVAAAADFDASLAADPLGIFADNASYFAGRSRYEAGLLLEAQASLQAFETAFPTSVLIDNGRYYLGRAFYNAGLLTESIPPFTRVALTPGSIYEDNALYFTGRADYRLALFADAIAAFDTLEATQPVSQYVDNALGWESRARLDGGDCPGARATFVTLSTSFPASTEVARTDTYLVANGCP